MGETCAAVKPRHARMAHRGIETALRWHIPLFGSISGKLSSVTPTHEVPIAAPLAQPQSPDASAQPKLARTQRELGGRDGPDPTRFGDWELRGRCIDF
jgi:hypothetical protein